MTLNTSKPQGHEQSSDNAPGSTAIADGRALVTTKLSWLQRCATIRAINKNGIALAIAILFVTEYVGRSKSRKRFYETGRLIVNPSQRTLAKELGCSQTAIVKAMDVLVLAGVMKVLSHGVAVGKSSEYELIGLAPRPNTPEAKTEHHTKLGLPPDRTLWGVQSTSSKPQKLITARSAPNKSSEDKKSGKVTSTPAKPSADAILECLKEIWPRKNSDSGALRGVWRKQVTNAGIDPVVVLKRAERWCFFWKHNDGKPPHLGSWLTDQGWKRTPKWSDRMPEHYARMMDRGKTGDEIIAELGRVAAAAAAQKVK